MVKITCRILLEKYNLLNFSLGDLHSQIHNLFSKSRAITDEDILQHLRPVKDGMFCHPETSGYEEEIVSMVHIVTSTTRLIDNYTTNSTRTDLSDDQLRAMSNARYTLSLLTGLPGTGKTFTCARIVQQALRDEYTCVVCTSPTGAAAYRLFAGCKQYIDKKSHKSLYCSTLHKIVYSNKHPLLTIGVHKTDKELTESPWKIVLIIDEISLADIYLAHRLFSFLVKHINTVISTVMVGDDKQLASIGPGAFLRDIIMSDLLHSRVVCLKDVKRQGPGSLIVRNALLVQPLNSTHIHYVSELKEHPGEMEIYYKPDMLSFAKTFLEQQKPKRFMVITNLKRFSNSNDLNSFCQELYNPLGVLKVKGKTVQYPRGNIYSAGCSVRRNDDIIFTCNSSGKDKCTYVNGLMARVLGVTEQSHLSVESDFVPGDPKSPLGLQQFIPNWQLHTSLAYCNNVNKLQGGQWPNVLYLVDGGGDMLCRKRLFTAMTRAQKHLVIIAPTEYVLQKCMQHDIVRSTNLIDISR